VIVSSGFGALSAFEGLPALLLLGACGLWLGCCRPVVPDFSIGSLLGGFVAGVSGLGPALGAPGVSAAVLGLVGGGVVAIARTDSFVLRCVYFVACGYVLGILVPTPVEGRHAVLCGALVVVAPIAIGFYLSLLPDREVWFIARRVMGSWIIAVSLLVCAFTIKYGDAGAGRSAVWGKSAERLAPAGIPPGKGADVLAGRGRRVNINVCSGNEMASRKGFSRSTLETSCGREGEISRAE